MSFRLTRRRVAALVLSGICAIALLVVSDSVCITAWVTHGVALEECPDGRIRPTYEINAQAFQRGGVGTVHVLGRANYTIRGAERVLTEAFDGFDISLSLIDSAGNKHPLAPVEKTRWESHSYGQSAQVKVPVLNDGEFTLEGQFTSRMGVDTVTVPIGFYAPARVHVLTDRPLYEPGQQIQFRSVVLKAQDLSPLEGRPGLWTVSDPTGEIVLEEKVGAGPWGVASGSFPLDRGAATGDWRIRWTSGQAMDEAVVRVEPFTVPRFRIEAAPVKSFYGPGNRPVIQGAVVYASGAPVANASLQISWNVLGDWPQPQAWRDGALPPIASAGRDGRFTLELPEVPMDLRGRNTLAASITAIDPAGDRVNTFVPVLMSEDTIQVDTVTELGDGLVEGFNNRMYVRAARADGQPLAGATVKVKRSWDAKDPGITAVADEDGVASLQIDPGVAVNVVIPPMPYRRPPPERAVHLSEVTDLISGGEVTLADQVAVERSLASFERCSMQTLTELEERVFVRIAPSGRVAAVAASPTRAGRCLAEVAGGRSFPEGKDRMLILGLSVSPADATYVSAQAEDTEGLLPELQPALDDALLGARACLPKDATTERLPRALEWRSRVGSKEISLGWVADPNGESHWTSVAAAGCLQSRIPERLSLTTAATTDAMGVVALYLNGAESMDEESRPQATTFLGYEFVVSAAVDGREVGKTKLRMRPGTVPHLRLRPSTVVASVGEPVDLQLLRGPSYSAELPKKITVRVGAEVKTLDVVEKKVRYVVPKDAKGWLEFEASGARALVYVRSGSDLTVSLTPDQQSYAPGALAHLKLETRIGGKPGQAAVGLFGVDETLGQLAPLPGADSLSKVRPQVAMASAAFGILDAQALTLGRIRGANAAAATVLRVSTIPTVEQADAPAYASHASSVDANGELTDAFYNVLSELHVQARKWETSAAKAELASPATIAKLWGEAITACEGRKEKVTDAFGRKVRLSMLPQDLLALTDPRAVIIAGTRLPEDVENWSKWVAEESP